MGCVQGQEEGFAILGQQGKDCKAGAGLSAGLERRCSGERMPWPSPKAQAL